MVVVLVGGCLGLLGIVFSTVSAHPIFAPVEAFYPIDVRCRAGPSATTVGRGGRVWAVAIGMVIAIVILVIISFHLAIHPRHIKAAPLGLMLGAASVGSGARPGDELPEADPMLAGGASDDLAAKAEEWWTQAHQRLESIDRL